MSEYTQEHRTLAVATPLGKDVLLLVAMRAREALSEPFSIELDLVASLGADVPFDQLLGAPIGIRVAGVRGAVRRFHGICAALVERERDDRFCHFAMSVVPRVWTLGLTSRSRIFQHKTVKAVLEEVLRGLDVKFDLRGKYEPRDYLVQYRETDLDFASRLMEEEGIWYWFDHAESSHRMIVGDTPEGHESVSPAKALYEKITGGPRDDARVHAWEKSQTIRSGKVTLRDHSFERPRDKLESSLVGLATAQAGAVAHKLLAAGASGFERYDYPGGYAQRFDGIASGGGEQPAETGKIAPDGDRTARVRMEQETASAVVVGGTGDCLQFSAGRRFQLSGHFDGDGPWVLVSVEHRADASGEYRADGGGDSSYVNNFTCVPLSVPWRPQRRTPRPVVHGAQTATVVGPAGEEIFTDKYGRVKVQFHWDREGRNDDSSSCWIRVGSIWSGKAWGAVHIPRIGQEVIVDFLEGDPDQPIVVGSVYNADQMPPYKLPDNKTQSGVKSRSTPKGGADNFNELRFEDKKGSEEVYFHAEKNFTRIVENDDVLKVGLDKKNPGSQTIDVHMHRTEVVHAGDETVTIAAGKRTITVNKGDDLHDVQQGNRTVTVGKGNDLHQVKTGNRTVEIDKGNDSLTITTGNRVTKVSAGSHSTDAATKIEFVCGGSKIVMTPSSITIQSSQIKIQGGEVESSASATNTVKGSMVKIN